MVTDEDIERSGFNRIDLIDECMMAMYISDNPTVRSLAGTILHLLDEFPWDDERFGDAEDLQFQGPVE